MIAGASWFAVTSTIVVGTLSARVMDPMAFDRRRQLLNCRDDFLEVGFFNARR